MNSASDVSPGTVATEPADDWSRLIRRFLICNPFYLVSAALLLLGVNRLSVDPGFLGDERQNLLFNFVALQVYGALLAGTSIVLRRRRVWYDSALLVVVEHGLVLVPFMLVSQAALISERLGWVLTAMGGGLVIGRALAVGRGYPEFNLPSRALALGLVILVANVTLPFGFQAVVARTAISDWEVPNRWIWLAAMPALTLGGLLLPRMKRRGALEPERGWLPFLIYALWLGGTGVHVWCVAYVAKFPLEGAWLAPAATAVCWVLFARARELTGGPAVALRCVALAASIAAPLLAVSDSRVLVAALIPSLLATLAVGFLGDDALRKAARWIALAGFFLLACGLPEEWWLRFDLERGDVVQILIGGCIVGVAFRTAHPFAGVIAGMVLGLGLNWATHGAGLPLIVLTGLGFALIHSIFWDAEAHSGANFLRLLISAIWVGDAVIWTRDGGVVAMGWSGGFGLLVGAAWVISNRLRGEWGHWAMGLCAALTMGAGPVQWASAHATTGVVALVASFVCFGVGTAIAWRRGMPSGTRIQGPEN